MNDTCAPVKMIGWLGETWGFWIQTGAFVLSALAGVAVIYHNAFQGRVRATIDLIIHQKADTELMKCIAAVYKLSEDSVKFSTFASNLNTEESKCILKVLNNHEFIALGIHHKAFSEKIYKASQCSNFIKVWDASRGMIHEIRQQEKKDTLFQEFEWLAKRWKKDPIKLEK